MEVANESFRIWGILSDKLHGWVRDGVAIFPNLIVAVVVMAVFQITSKLISGFLDRFLQRHTEDPAIAKLIATTVRLMILFFGLFTALGILNLEKTVGSLLAGAGVLGLAIGFAFQEIAANFFSGILIALRKPFAPGDIVQIDKFIGKVRELTLRTTNIVTFDGLEVLIPNKDMFTKPATNFTSLPGRRIQLDVGVSYAADLRKVENIALSALESIQGRLSDRPIEFYYTSFGDSAINFRVFIWIEYPAGNWANVTMHQAIIALKEAFEKNKISIPFPIRTLDFGDGASLRAALFPTPEAAAAATPAPAGASAPTTAQARGAAPVD